MENLDLNISIVALKSNMALVDLNNIKCDHQTSAIGIIFYLESNIFLVDYFLKVQYIVL